MRRLLLLAALIAGVQHVYAQDIFGSTDKLPARRGFIIGINGAVDAPGADMAKRFGTSYKVGPAVTYKTKSNWLFGGKFDFIFGGDIREDSLLINMTDDRGNIFNQDGQRLGVGIFERGYMAGLQAGRIFNISKKSSDNGIMVMTGAGFIQHKINIFDKDKSMPQLRDDYRKGYDRLTNGWYVEQYLGYSYFANNNLVNFHIGLDFTAAFTKGRRDFIYDVMRTDDKSRIDLLFGIRAGWYIPIFKRKSEEFYFE